jgi:hypothetical protein
MGKYLKKGTVVHINYSKLSENELSSLADATVKNPE